MAELGARRGVDMFLSNAFRLLLGFVLGLLTALAAFNGRVTALETKVAADDATLARHEQFFSSLGDKLDVLTATLGEVRAELATLHRGGK